MSRPKLNTIEDLMLPIIPKGQRKKSPPHPKLSFRKKIFGKEFDRLKYPHSMGKLINYALKDILLQYPNSILFGEDVAQKGGVYNVTSELYDQFGIRRVFDSPLDETSIIGFGIGLGHNGFLPIPEIQF